MADYETVSYDSLLRGVCDLIGEEFEDLQTIDAQTIKRHVSDGIEMAWRYGRWPELSRSERRSYRPLYASATVYALGAEVLWLQEQAYYHRVQAGSSGEDPTDANGVLNSDFWAVSKSEYNGPDYNNATTYAAGDIVYYPTTDTHYQCIAASTGNLPTDTSFWGPLVPFTQRIAFDQTSENEWEPDDFFGVFNKDPKVHLSATPLQHNMMNDGVYLFGDDVPARAWLFYRTKAPILTGNEFDATATYAVGDQISYSSTANGTVLNFYDCIVATTAGQDPDDTPNSWQLVEIPRFMLRFLKEYAHQMMMPTDGQDDRRHSSRRIGEKLLEEYLLRRRAQNVQQTRTRVGTRRNQGIYSYR